MKDILVDPQNYIDLKMKQKKETYFKLNNRGWGLQVMMIFILILMIALVVIYILINRNFPQYVDYNYHKEETKVVLALKKYYKENDIELDDKEEKIISIKKLKTSGALENFNKCTGYGLIKKDGKITYNAFIRCDKYITDGYLNYLDEN